MYWAKLILLKEQLSLRLCMMLVEEMYYNVKKTQTILGCVSFPRNCFLGCHATRCVTSQNGCEETINIVSVSAFIFFEVIVCQRKAT